MRATMGHMTDEWAMEIQFLTDEKPVRPEDDNWSHIQRVEPGDRHISIRITRFGVPIFTATGPLNATFENGGPDALQDFLRAANRKIRPKEFIIGDDDD